LSGLPAIADDGGIEISALNNEPGVRTRRWLGHHSTDEELINHMLKITKELPENNRNACFKLILSLALPDGKIWSVTGGVNGIISKEPNLHFIKGYPFRSFFYLPRAKKFYHEDELTPREQKLYNHRYKAVQKLLPIISEVLSIK
jgi:XTP/dITP diphosphohydrolase